MRDVVVLGAGLTGLAAAYELERHKINYTLVEVKRQLGGSIYSVEQNGAILDGGAFALADTFDADWLTDLGLADGLFSLAPDVVAFKDGTAALVQAIKSRLSAPRLMRMAVSSIGEIEDGRLGVCMENGLMFDAQSIIVALPARWAERVFYGYINALTEKLLDYRYDALYRVALVVPTDGLPELRNPPDMAHVFIHRTDHASRVPEGHTLLQFGLRLLPERVSDSQTLVNFVREAFDLPQPVAQLVRYWPQADPISCYDDAHAAWVHDLRSHLPQRIALVGSDYCLNPPTRSGIVHFEERIAQGRAAAQQVIATL